MSGTVCDGLAVDGEVSRAGEVVCVAGVLGPKNSGCNGTLDRRHCSGGNGNQMSSNVGKLPTSPELAFSGRRNNREICGVSPGRAAGKSLRSGTL